MLVLSRFTDQKIRIGNDIVVTVVRVRNSGRVQIGIDAPDGVAIMREEVAQRETESPASCDR